MMAKEFHSYTHKSNELSLVYHNFNYEFTYMNNTLFSYMTYRNYATTPQYVHSGFQSCEIKPHFQL